MKESHEKFGKILTNGSLNAWRPDGSRVIIDDQYSMTNFTFHTCFQVAYQDWRWSPPLLCHSVSRGSCREPSLPLRQHSQTTNLERKENHNNILLIVANIMHVIIILRKLIINNQGGSTMVA